MFILKNEEVQWRPKYITLIYHLGNIEIEELYLPGKHSIETRTFLFNICWSLKTRVENNRGYKESQLQSQ